MGFPLLLFAWTITEIIRLVEHLQQQSNATRVRNLLGFSRCLILLTLFLFCRYSMYAINLFSSPPFPLTWLRCLLRSLYPSAHFICHHQCHKHVSKSKILCQSSSCSIDKFQVHILHRRLSRRGHWGTPLLLLCHDIQ